MTTTLTAGNILGGWATSNSDSFATYNTSTGVTSIATFAATDVTTNTSPLANIGDLVTTTRTVTSRSTNTWRLNPAAAQILNFGTVGSSAVVTFTTGLLTAGAGSSTFNSGDPSSAITVDVPGTSGNGTLWVYNYAANVNTIAVRIADEAGANTPADTSDDKTLTLVKGGNGSLILAQAASYAQNATTTLSSFNVTGTGIGTGLQIGMVIGGSNFAPGTRITAIAADLNSYTVDTLPLAGGTFATGLGNSYTGGTVVNGGTMSLNSTLTNVALIPGNLTINDGGDRGPDWRPGRNRAHQRGDDQQRRRPRPVRQQYADQRCLHGYGRRDQSGASAAGTAA